MEFFKKITVPVVLSLVVIFQLGCKGRMHVFKSPPHYNFGEALPEKLDLRIQEISGIVWDTRVDEFLCHNDEKGIVFYLDKETKMIKRQVEFGGKGDYEDITLYKGVPYVLRSDGIITKVVTDSTGKTVGIEVGKLTITGKKDFETLYYDDSLRAIITICKNCAVDDKEVISAYAFYPDSIGFDQKPIFTIDAEQVKALSPQKSSRFQPSAAAVHPVLKKLFIISSASNQLVIADRMGKVESVFVLAKKFFPQPEGITFKNNGDMYISNEGATSKATLLKFLYKP